MGRKKAKEAVLINRIKEVSETEGVSTRLLSLWAGVNYATASSWNSNTSQPSEQHINELGELLEEDNRMLIKPQGRVKTGLGKALEMELKRLHKVENLPYEVEKFDSKKNKAVKVNNPELIKKLREFAKKFKK
jgi:DNA-binding transcriptional regulator YiaG